MLRPPSYVDLKFHVDGVDRIVTAKFVYDRRQKRYVLDSDLIVEVSAINKTTGKPMFGYYLKRNVNARNPVPVQEMVEEGYVGYSPDTGCWYFGTLYVDYYGVEIFIPATGVTALMNPPMCGYYYA
jgi:hypothetical protein